MEKINKKVLVVLSGGQDSVTCLGIALAMFAQVEAVSFTYGQKHKVELESAVDICKRFGVPQKVVDLSFLGSVVTSALTGEGSVNDAHAYKEGLPASFVPNRNALFLTVAHAHAQEIGAKVIMAGMCQTDYSGYPDCRNLFIKSLETALNIGYETQIKIVTPVMWLDKAQTFALAESVGFLEEVIKNSHTCYNGDHTTENAWGFGCGECPACKLRAQGYAKFIEFKKFGNTMAGAVAQALGNIRMDCGA